MTTILYVCSGNTCRSPLAMVIGRIIAPHLRHVSAGTAPGIGDPAASCTKAIALTRYGVDLSEHRAQYVADAYVPGMRVIAMSDGNARACRRLAGWREDDVTTLSIPDPFGGTLDDYRETADMLERELTRILPVPTTWQRIVATFRGWSYYTGKEA